jgi:hypothetical protein
VSHTQTQRRTRHGTARKTNPKLLHSKQFPTYKAKEERAPKRSGLFVFACALLVYLVFFFFAKARSLPPSPPSSPRPVLTRPFPPRVASRSLRLFQQRKPSETKEWQQKLPDFVLRLEEAVYRGARTKVRFLSQASPLHQFDCFLFVGKTLGGCDVCNVAAPEGGRGRKMHTCTYTPVPSPHRLLLTSSVLTTSLPLSPTPFDHQ